MSAPPSGAMLVRLDALADPCAVVVYVADASVLVTRRGEHVAAFHNRCPHAGYPLERPDGRVVVQEGRYLICTAHGASFRLEDGACAGGPCNGESLARAPIQISDGVVRLA